MISPEPSLDKKPSLTTESESPDPKPDSTTGTAQGWLARFLPGKWPVISVGSLTAIIGLYEAIVRIWLPHIPSHTEIIMANANSTVIAVHVSNTGGKSSTLQAYRLNFEASPVETRLPIENRTLRPIDTDESKAVIPGRSDVTIQLTVLGLRAQVRPNEETERFTRKEIESLMKGKNVRLEIDVKESNDRGPAHHMPYDDVSAERLRDFIMHWLPQYEEQ
jgi:hypothetical protein